MPSALRHQRRVLRLKVGREAGILPGSDVDGAQAPGRRTCRLSGDGSEMSQPAWRSLAFNSVRCSGAQPLTMRSPPVIAPAMRNVPASMRSGMMV